MTVAANTLTLLQRSTTFGDSNYLARVHFAARQSAITALADVANAGDAQLLRFCREVLAGTPRALDAVASYVLSNPNTPASVFATDAGGDTALSPFVDAAVLACKVVVP